MQPHALVPGASQERERGGFVGLLRTRAGGVELPGASSEVREAADGGAHVLATAPLRGRQLGLGPFVTLHATAKQRRTAPPSDSPQLRRQAPVKLRFGDAVDRRFYREFFVGGRSGDVFVFVVSAHGARRVQSSEPGDDAAGMEDVAAGQRVASAAAGFQAHGAEGFFRHLPFSKAGGARQRPE